MGLDTKTYSLTDRQSQCDFYSDFGYFSSVQKRGLNLEVVKLMTVQVTRQPLRHKIFKISMICSA
jgi:hypothetical protein